MMQRMSERAPKLVVQVIYRDGSIMSLGEIGAIIYISSLR